MTTLPQGYTNRVQVFDRVIRKVLNDVISENHWKPFIDDIAVKPKTKSYFRDSNGRPEEVAPGIRRFVLEAIISLDKVLADIEQAGATISREKCEFLKESLKVVAYICGEQGRSPKEVKMKKIEDWPTCKNVTDVRAFIGLCVYYRIWIMDFSVIAEPLIRKHMGWRLVYQTSWAPLSITPDHNTRSKPRPRPDTPAVNVTSWTPAPGALSFPTPTPGALSFPTDSIPRSPSQRNILQIVRY